MSEETTMKLSKRRKVQLILLAGAVAKIVMVAGAVFAADQVAPQTDETASGSSRLLACLPDPLDINSGERDLGDVVEDAFAHSPFGRLKAALAGEEQADFAPPHLKLVPGADCFGGSETAAAQAEPND